MRFASPFAGAMLPDPSEETSPRRTGPDPPVPRSDLRVGAVPDQDPDQHHDAKCDQADHGDPFVVAGPYRLQPRFRLALFGSRHGNPRAGRYRPPGGPDGEHDEVVTQRPVAARDGVEAEAVGELVEAAIGELAAEIGERLGLPVRIRRAHLEPAV